VIERRKPTPDVHQLAVGKARIDTYNRRLLLLAAATAVVLIVLMFFTLVKVISLAEEAKENSREAAAQTIAIKTLVQRQASNDATRQQLIDEAVAQIAAEQYRALVAHDRRTEELLRRNLRLLNQEVNSPANRERVLVPIPLPPAAGTPAAPAPAPVGPATGAQPEPAPQPAPAPAPCQQRGKSGKCRK
jgi:hypothetical protein